MRPGTCSVDGQSDVVAGTTRATAACGSWPNRRRRFDPQRWANVTPATGWTFLPGRFTGDELTDVVGYHARRPAGCGSGSFRTLGVEGYCWPLSAAPGESLDIHLSSEGELDVVYARHVADATGVRSVPVAAASCTPGVQATAAACVARWMRVVGVHAASRSPTGGGRGSTRRAAGTSTATRPT